MKDKKHLQFTDFDSTPLYHLWHSSPIVLNFVDTCNFALTLFFKCDVTKFGIPLPLVTQGHTSSIPSVPLTCDVILWMPLYVVDISEKTRKNLKKQFNIHTLNITVQGFKIKEIKSYVFPVIRNFFRLRGTVYLQKVVFYRSQPDKDIVHTHVIYKNTLLTGQYFKNPC